MAKRKTLREEDIARLKKKIAERKPKTGKVLGDAALRALRKRLKREQRKRRTLALRLAHAQGKKRERAWEAAALAMQKLGVPQSRIEHLRKQDNPALVAEVVKEFEGKP